MTEPDRAPLSTMIVLLRAMSTKVVPPAVLQLTVTHWPCWMSPGCTEKEVICGCGTGVDVGGTGVDVEGTGVDVGGTGVDVGGTGVGWLAFTCRNWFACDVPPGPVACRT